MCAVSAIYDHGRRDWPTPFNPIIPNSPWPADTPTRKEFDELKKLVEAAREYDNATGQPDCELDEKAEWFKELEARVAAVEAAVAPPTPPINFKQLNLDIQRWRNVTKAISDEMQLWQITIIKAAETYEK